MEYISDFGYKQAEDDTKGRSQLGESDTPVEEEHLLVIDLLYSWVKSKSARPEFRRGYASLDTLREASELPAWRVWEIIDDLQELGLVSCIWDPRPLRVYSETSEDLRFLRCTQAGLTNKGLSYPPLLEYRRLRQHRRRKKLAAATDHIPQRQAPPRRPRYPRHKPGIMRHHPREFNVHRPREQAVRRLAYLAGALLLATVGLIVLILT